MIQKLILFVLRFKFGAAILDAVNGLHERVIGHRTEILVGLEAVLAILKHLNILGPDLAKDIDALSLAILGAIPVTVAEKVKKALEIADEVAPVKP